MLITAIFHPLMGHLNPTEKACPRGGSGAYDPQGGKNDHLKIINLSERIINFK